MCPRWDLRDRERPCPSIPVGGRTVSLRLNRSLSTTGFLVGTRGSRATSPHPTPETFGGRGGTWVRSRVGRGRRVGGPARRRKE